MVDIVTRAGKGSPLTNNEVDANFTNLAEVASVTGEPMGHEDRTTSTISFNASTRTFTIAPVNGSFTVWCKGKKVVVSSAQTVTIPNTTGMYSIYFDANGALAAKAGYFTFSVEAPTAYIYWNAATGACPYFGDERHGVVLDWQTHEYLHRTRGAALASGFAASGYTLGGNGSSNAHAQLTLEGGTFFDEDMKIIVTATNTPTAGTWEQDLLSPARIPVLYLSGTGWVIDAPTDYPLKQGTTRPQYNALSGGVWSTADVANNKYATSWILATNNLTYPVIAVIGQAESDSQTSAEAVDFTSLQLPGFPSVEFRPLYKLVFQCADNYSNTVKASLVSITDIRSLAAAGVAASLVTDHGALTGLSDDDHPQYLSVDTVRTSLTAAVKASFLPSQTGNSGKFLTTDATSASWTALTSSNITTALGFTPYNATNPAGYISGITSSNVTTALGFTPYNATNPSGYVTAAGARGAISVTGAGSYDSATGVINIVGGVTSFNTRTGAISLTSADVTTALGFTPYNNTNPNNYLTGITSMQVTTALGYTPYNSSNPSGYITGITSGMVTTALGFTPYNSSNPSGYITSSALSSYLPLSGGTLTGGVTLNASRFYVSSPASGQANNATIHIRDTEATGANNSFAAIGFSSSPGADYYIGKYSNGGTGYLQIRNHLGTGIWLLASDGTVTQNGNLLINGSNQVLHAGNYTSYSPSLGGSGASGTWGISVTGNAATITNFKAFGTIYINPNGSSANCTTAQMVTHLTNLGFFNYATAIGKCAWDYAGNNDLTDTGFGTIDLAGCVIETANTGSEKHIRITRPTTGAGGFQVLVYVDHGSGYSPGWRAMMTSENIGSFALPLSGGIVNGTGYFRKNQTAGDYTTAALWTESYGNTSTGIAFHISGVAGRYLEMRNNSADLFWQSSAILNASNYSSYALPLSGGTVTGAARFNSTLTMGGYANSSGYIAFNNAGTYWGLIGNYGTNDWRLGYGPQGSIAGWNLSWDASGNVGVNGNLGAGGKVTSAGNNGFANDVYYGAVRNPIWSFGNASTYGISYYQGSAGIGGQDSFGVSLNGTTSVTSNNFAVGVNNSYVNNNVILHAGNYSSYALPLSGGTLSGGLTVNNAVINAPQGFVSNGNPWGTASSAFFPNGITTAGNTNWIYGATYLGNAPGNGSGAEVASNGRFYNSVSTNSAMHVRRTGSAGNAVNLYTALFEQTYGDHSWGIVAEFRAGGSGGSDRPSILFSNGYNSTTWSVGFGGYDDQFRINQNHGHRNGDWGTERFRIDTGGTAYLGGNVVIHGGNYTNYVQLPYAGWDSYPGKDANTVSGGAWMRSFFTYANNAPHSGPFVHFPAGGYDLQFNAAYSGHDVSVRARNGDNGTFMAWKRLLTDYNYTSYTAARNGSGYLIPENWTQLNGYYGLYSPNNGAHFYPNNGSYGSWRADGNRDGWRGINFENSVVLMMNDNESGHHKNGYGWQFRWQDGTLHCHKSSYGGGTDATVLDSSNYSSYALPLSGGVLTGNLTINNSSPTIYLQDTDHRSAMIHVNSNIFYVLRGSGTNSGSWATYNGVWPMEINLENNNATFGGNVTAYSDERLKSDWLELASDYVERLAQVKNGTFTRIDTQERQIGVSAQSLLGVAPEGVIDGKHLSVAYGNVALASAVELAKRVVDQEKRIAHLESLISKLIGD